MAVRRRWGAVTCIHEAGGEAAAAGAVPGDPNDECSGSAAHGYGGVAAECGPARTRHRVLAIVLMARRQHGRGGWCGAWPRERPRGTPQTRHDNSRMACPQHELQAERYCVCVCVWWCHARPHS